MDLELASLPRLERYKLLIGLVIPRPIGWVARQCGFGDDERMRRSFMRWMGISPSDYRARFRSARREALPQETAA